MAHLTPSERAEADRLLSELQAIEAQHWTPELNEQHMTLCHRYWELVPPAIGVSSKGTITIN